MKRTEFKRKAPIDKRALLPFVIKEPRPRRSGFKRKAPKRRSGHDKRMLEACRGQRCWLDIPGICQGRRETVVPCHSNALAHGKGMGLKVPDRLTVPGCMHCHAWLDAGGAPREEKAAAWQRAYDGWSAYRDRAVEKSS